jgi:hypothetical protein
LRSLASAFAALSWLERCEKQLIQNGGGLLFDYEKKQFDRHFQIRGEWHLTLLLRPRRFVSSGFHGFASARPHTGQELHPRKLSSSTPNGI